jgi:hypothetical protein
MRLEEFISKAYRLQPKPEAPEPKPELKQLLPKHLADRALKLDPRQVEAEVARILSTKPAAPQISPGWGGALQPGAIVPVTPDQIAEMARQQAGMQQAYTNAMQQQQRGFLQQGLGNSLM